MMIVFLLMMTVVFFTMRKEIKMAFNFYMTEFGLSATIHSLAGGKITIDNVEIGSSATAPTDYNAVKNLLNRELQAQIISQKKIDNTLNLKFQFDNKKVTNDFFWTEIAVFATVTKADNSIETGIIIYGYNEENANHIPAYTDNNSLNKFICQIGINYSDELNVTIKLDEFGDYVENSEFTKHLNSENPHGITPDIINAAKAEHCHSANDITSGVLSVERGGTGTASLLELTQSLIPSIFNAKGIANTNLDSILSPGIYFVFNGCSNCPVTYNGILFVFEIDKGSFYQCYLPNYGGRYYMRNKANNYEWSHWQ